MGISPDARIDRPVDGSTEVPVRDGAAGPVRTCVGCHRRDEKSRLVRMVADGAGRLRIDFRSRQAGRGVYVHADRRCIGVLLRGGVAERSLRRRVVNLADLSPSMWLDGAPQSPETNDVSRSVE